MAESKSDRAHWAFIAVGLICGFATLVLGFPVALWSSRHGTVYGFVTHYREQDPYWAFDLRRTDQGGQPCVDRKGFALPAVPVLYRVDQLHGPPLEEGSRVVVRGGWRLGWFRARAIWNLSLLSEVPTAGVPMVVRGRAINVQPRQDQDMRYPGQWLQVLSFRLQLTDDTFENLLRDVQDNPQPPLPVEVRARVIGGAPQDGDKVEVHGQMVRGILYGREVYDHSAAGAALQVKEYAGAP